VRARAPTVCEIENKIELQTMFRVAVFNTKKFDREPLLKANNGRHELVFFEHQLNHDTVVCVVGFQAVRGVRRKNNVFVNRTFFFFQFEIA
jgi:hypothetical protein